MAISTTILSYCRGETTYNIALYDSPADVGANYVAITDGTTPLYAALGDPSHEYASHLRVQSGTTKAILTQVPPTPALQVFITKEIYRDILQIDPESYYTYAASPNNENGTVLPSSAEVLQGTSVTFTPTAKSGYSFINWTVITSAGVSTVSGSTLTRTINEHTRIIANFSA